MAKQDEKATQTGVDDIQKVVETSLKPEETEEDETLEDEEDQKEEAEESEEEDSEEETEDDSEEEDEDESEEDDSEEETEEESEEETEDDSKKYRFEQFAGESDEEYIKNLEEGYENSSKEAVRLKNEADVSTRRLNAIMDAAKADPKLGEALQNALTEAGTTAESLETKPGDDVETSNNPFLKAAETEWKTKSQQEAKEFVEANPEVLSDPEINGKVRHWMEVFTREEMQQNGKLLTAGEALEKAYNHLGLENKLKKEEDLAAAAKKNSAPSRPKSSTPKKKKSSGKDFTQSQLDYASKLGLSKEKLEKYAK